MRSVNDHVMKFLHTHNGGIAFRYNWECGKYTVFFSPLFNIHCVGVFKDEKMIDVREEFWGAPGKWTAFFILARAIEKMKMA